MDIESKKQEIRNLLKNVENDDVRARINKALDCLTHPGLLRIVNDAITKARRGGYLEIALKLSDLAHELHPENPYFLVQVSTILNFLGQSQEVIEKINKFCQRVDINSLKPSEKDTVMVTLASAYKGIGEISKGIQILESLQSNRPNVLEELAEQYFKDNKPEKTIELLGKRKDLTKDMALWLAKSYYSRYQWEEALKVLEPFKVAPEIKEFYEEVAMKTTRRPGAGVPGKVTGMPNPKKVFVVYGRNEPARDSIFNFLRAIGLEPIEWTQALALTGKASPYIGEVLDSAFSIAQAVIVLLTGDDEAKLRDKYIKTSDADYERTLTPQARPNVLFEAGMAFGRYPERTILIELGNLRPFSDIAGRHVLKLNNTSEKRHELALKLQTAGCDVDLTGTDWLKVGNFEVEE